MLMLIQEPLSASLRFVQIQIHLMLMLIITAILKLSLMQYSNTSHVNVNPTSITEIKFAYNNSNTSHVNVNQEEEA